MIERRAIFCIVSLVLAGCAAQRPEQQTPLGPVPPGVVVDLQESNYTIVASTPEDLLAGLRASPGGQWFQHRWHLYWRYSYGPVERPSPRPGSVTDPPCGIRDPRLTLTFTQIVPVWEAPAEADPALVEAWDTFTDAIRLHGEGHRDVAVDAIREISRIASTATSLSLIHISEPTRPY